ncbi:TPA: hypothetical protein ACXGBZ_001253 [Klebsiella pneumoniae]
MKIAISEAMLHHFLFANICHMVANVCQCLPMFATNCHQQSNPNAIFRIGQHENAIYGF